MLRKRRPTLRTAVLALFSLTAAFVAIACGSPDSGNEAIGNISDELITQRPQYDVSRPFAELIKPHFFATSKNGHLVEALGSPDLILERDGKITIRLKQEDEEQYLDLLALESELIGEHPVHKAFRLLAMGIPIETDLEKRLQPSDFDDELFHAVQFEYLQDSETGGVITEVFPDGTFLIIPFDVPSEWRRDEDGIPPPTHLHVNPRALNVRESSLAREFEDEILALPFDDQRYPSPPLAQRQCDVYNESLQATDYGNILSAVGYRFTPAHVLMSADGEPLSFGERLSTLLRQGAGAGTQYFGFEPYWTAERVRDLQATWLGECDTAGAVHRYSSGDGEQDGYYVTVRRSLEPEKTQRYKIMRLADDGSGEAIYTAPGIILMSRPLPSDGDYWLMSTEGWKSPEDGNPPDPRWQSVYLMNMKAHDDYRIVQYPISQYPDPPEAGLLYGASDIMNRDSRFLMNTLYGFKDEGGGLWVTDLSDERFYEKPDGFVRIVDWDHTLSWFPLENEGEGPSKAMSIFLTGKEVASEFAMTANIMRIKGEGLDSSVESQERLVQMVGWNPVPFALQRLPDHKFRVAVETHLNYENSLLPRARGVYIVSVDTTQ